MDERRSVKTKETNKNIHRMKGLMQKKKEDDQSSGGGKKGGRKGRKRQKVDD